MVVQILASSLVVNLEGCIRGFILLTGSGIWIDRSLL